MGTLAPAQRASAGTWKIDLFLKGPISLSLAMLVGGRVPFWGWVEGKPEEEPVAILEVPPFSDMLRHLVGFSIAGRFVQWHSAVVPQRKTPTCPYHMLGVLTMSHWLWLLTCDPAKTNVAAREKDQKHPFGTRTCLTCLALNMGNTARVELERVEERDRQLPPCRFFRHPGGRKGVGHLGSPV